MAVCSKHQHTFSYAIEYVLESDLDVVVHKKCSGLPGKAKDHLRLHAGGPLVLLNGAYLGSIREFEIWADKTYGCARGVSSWSQFVCVCMVTSVCHVGSGSQFVCVCVVTSVCLGERVDAWGS